MNFYTKLHSITRIIKNEKLIKENSPRYFNFLFGLCLIYSLKVIRLASEAISVPTPPILTPNNKSL